MLSFFVEQSGVSSGWLTLALAGVALVSYLLGCCNGAIMVSRTVLKDDIRQHGSGNGGLTNFVRIHGGLLSLVVVLIDVMKMVLSVLLAQYIFGQLSPVLVLMGKYWAGLWCELGHMFPCNFQFRGGKGVLSGGTLALLIDWRIALLVWGAFLLLAVLTKYVSLGSCAAGFFFPIATAVLYQNKIITIMSILMGGLLIFKHRGNIVRLIKGTESKFSIKKKTVPPADPEQEEALQDTVTHEEGTH